jgi:membrane fusion protein (multidrug efflux system)
VTSRLFWKEDEMSNNNGPNADHVALIEHEEPVAVRDPDLAASAADHAEKKRRPLTRRTKVLVASVLALLIVTGAGYFIRNAFLYEDTDDAQVVGHVMPLSARINGQVLEVHVIEGQLVHGGDVLVVIDSKDYKVAADQARANVADADASAAGSRWSVPITSATAWSGLDSSRAAVRNAEAGVSAAEQNLEAAKATLLQAEANAAKTDADLARYAQLVAKEDISRQQYDQAVAAAKANRAAVLSATAAVQYSKQALQQAQGKLLQARADQRSAETAPQQVSVVRAKADSANALVERRKAELEQSELNLSYTVIRSPVTGIIGKKAAEVGQNVGVGQELVDVVPLDDIWVTANFKETQLAHMRPGQPVEIKVDAYGHAWRGHVTNLGGGTGSVFSLLPPENATGNYVKVVQRVPVRIDFDRPAGEPFNAAGLLKPGLSVEPDVRVR